MEPKNISPRLANGGDAADACIAAARSFVEQYCGWHIAPVREDTVLLDGNGLKILQLPSLHALPESPRQNQWRGSPRNRA